VPDLPRVSMADRTVGRTFTGNQGRVYRPSMFLTLTLPSYGKIRGGVPVNPASYDYRSAALDAVLFAPLVDRFWTNLRRTAGYRVQYFASVEAQHRLAAHLHAAIRGAIPRRVLLQTVAATYVQVWWPPFSHPVYADDELLPYWDGHDYVDPTTGVVLPTWAEALDQVQADPDARPVHVARFGAQTDLAGIIAPSEDADRAIRYLTKYLTKSIADTHTPARTPRSIRHMRRTSTGCTPSCAGCPAGRPARTGSATASNPRTRPWPPPGSLPEEGA
jgi:hypothetical protein